MRAHKECDLLVYGCGVLGRRAIRSFVETSDQTISRVVGVTRTKTNHEEIREFCGFGGAEAGAGGGGGGGGGGELVLISEEEGEKEDYYNSKNVIFSGKFFASAVNGEEQSDGHNKRALRAL